MHRSQRLKLARPRRYLLAATLLGSTIATAAGASDSKYFNGAFCRASFAFGAADLSTFADYSTNGSVGNRNTAGSLSLVCPVVRDTTGNTDGWDSVEIGYFDKSPLDITCNVFSASFADGTVVFPSPSGSSSNTAGTSWAKGGMLFGEPGAFTSLAGGYYYIACTVPPAVFVPGGPANQSGIAYYRVQEP